ncbi:MAG: triose-phosphate isomerase [Clostridia bacterium]|nr:triose-phosphate isomerase [Clostridia bacterium]
MHGLLADSRARADEVARRVAGWVAADVVVAVFPPFTALRDVAEVLAGRSVTMGAQDVAWEQEGAFTGEVSPPMLRDVGCTYAIVGHSERRRWCGEDDEVVARKAAACLAGGLTPVICVGEDERQRARGETAAVLRRQVGAVAAAGAARDAIFAYEPVWAIGTGLAATAADAAAAAALVREVVGAGVPVLYGGSVSPENASAFAAESGITGVLVGGASLDPAAFADIVRAFSA